MTDKATGFTQSGVSTDDKGGAQDIFYAGNGDNWRPTLVRGEGIYLWDDQGNCYIDASSGPVTCNLGHGHKGIIEAMSKQAQTLEFSFPSTARNLPNIQLANTLTQLAGDGFERAFFVSGGSEAVDMAIKFCRQYRYARGEKQRFKLISCQPSYHGMTLGTLAVSGDPVFGEVFGDMLTMARHVPAALSHRRPQGMTQDAYELQCAGQLEETIIALGQDEVLAFIVEPVGGSSSGANAPSETYFNAVRQICDKYGVFLIYDEVMSGVGRTGTFLTSHRWPKARPDISVVAKGLGAGYYPLGAMLTSAALVDELSALTGFNYAHTYNASPVACAVGIAVLSEIAENDLLKNTCDMGEYLVGKLRELQDQTTVIGDIRGRGLLLGVELVADKASKTPFPLEINATDRVRLIAQELGLFVYGRRSNGGRFGDVILLAPPLNVTCDDIDKIMKKFTDTICAFEAERGISHR
ncbi:aspartate aminotransferase family protein [Pseudomaricurvus alkylphenolicus]|uniref:aminotransferase family protein n=1 Tax=Pseudomaricurvus alkylphenolicus TaxID=1306991 RepID=UPI0014209A53|nr:aminotransferase class III-fold pyridoxal phosphate-dependent enzyme [Pseudomaricurvus alkylphenolicus]NIB38570.1 aspartate aminotransferase family protein [Pseudomaricurvus alkylphenolicus]